MEKTSSSFVSGLKGKETTADPMKQCRTIIWMSILSQETR